MESMSVGLARNAHCSAYMYMYMYMYIQARERKKRDRCIYTFTHTQTFSEFYTIPSHVQMPQANPHRAVLHDLASLARAPGKATPCGARVTARAADAGRPSRKKGLVLQRSVGRSARALILSRIAGVVQFGGLRRRMGSSKLGYSQVGRPSFGRIGGLRAERFGDLTGFRA